MPVWYVQPVGRHESGAYLIGSAEAPPPAGEVAFTLYHQDFMREAWALPPREDPYVGETTLEQAAAALPRQGDEWIAGEDLIEAFYAK